MKKNKDKKKSYDELVQELAYTKERADKAEEQLKEARKLQTTWCMTVDDFIDAYTEGLRTQLYRANGINDKKHHPVDLASVALSYAEVFDSVCDSIDWHKITGAKKPSYVIGA